MSILLAPDAVVLWLPDAEPDAHGWAQTLVPTKAWEGRGNVQEGVSRDDATATEPGGGGPYAPLALGSAQAYLPVDATVAPGMLLECRGREWLVTAVRVVTDPLSGGLGCQMADLTERGGETWPTDAEPPP